MVKSKIYWNLHKKCFSIKTGRLPVKHSNNFYISGAKFIVNEKRRQKVLRERSRNVHAWIAGEVLPADEKLKVVSRPIEVHYNPYRCGRFTIKNDWSNEEEYYGISEAPLVHCRYGKVYIINPKINIT